jgi:hypothetical protein
MPAQNVFVIARHLRGGVLELTLSVFRFGSALCNLPKTDGPGIERHFER